MVSVSARVGIVTLLPSPRIMLQASILFVQHKQGGEVELLRSETLNDRMKRIVQCVVRYLY